MYLDLLLIIKNIKIMHLMVLGNVKNVIWFLKLEIYFTNINTKNIIVIKHGIKV